MNEEVKDRKKKEKGRIEMHESICMKEERGAVSEKEENMEEREKECGKGQCIDG